MLEAAQLAGIQVSAEEQLELLALVKSTPRLFSQEVTQRCGHQQEYHTFAALMHRDVNLLLDKTCSTITSVATGAADRFSSVLLGPLVELCKNLTWINSGNQPILCS